MDFSAIWDTVASQGVWCVLFVWLFYSTRQDSSEREDRLLGIINQLTERIQDISDCLSQIKDSYASVNDKMEAMEDHVANIDGRMGTLESIVQESKG